MHEETRMQSDYDFRFGTRRHLRGHGLRGLAALALLLVALVFVAQTAGSFTVTGFSWLWTLMTRSGAIS